MRSMCLRPVRLFGVRVCRAKFLLPVVVAMGGLLVVACSGSRVSGSSSLVVTTASTNPPSSVSSTSTSATLASTTTSPPMSTIPSTTAVELGTVALGDVWRPGVTKRSVLYRATIGGGAYQLGAENCTQCDPTVPWAPVVLADGRIVIADNWNNRWVVISHGQAKVVAFTADTSIIGQPVLDDNGVLYVVIAHSHSAAATAALVVYNVDDLAHPVNSYPVPVQFFSQMAVVGNRVLVNGLEVQGATAAQSARPEIAYPSNGSIEVTWAGTHRTWQFPLDYNGTTVSSMPGLNDGSVLGWANNIGTQQIFLMRLFPNGQAVTVAIEPRVAFNGSVWLDERGLVQLERKNNTFEVARYQLPEPA